MDCCQNHPHVENRLAYCSRCGRPFCGDCYVELRNRPFCVDCKTEHVLDVLSGASELELDLAPVWKRGVAFFVDNCIFMGFAGAVLFALFVLTPGVYFDVHDPQHNQQAVLQVYQPLMLILTIFSLLYEGLLLQFCGQTVGKMMVGIKVVTPKGKPISAGQAWGRTAIRVLCWRLHVVSVVINAAFILSHERTCLHDMAARTRVVNLGF